MCFHPTPVLGASALTVLVSPTNVCGGGLSTGAIVGIVVGVVAAVVIALLIVLCLADRSRKADMKRVFKPKDKLGDVAM